MDGTGTNPDSQLVRCDITGEMVRPEDAVHFQGRTLSAVGKQMLFDRFRHGQSIQQRVLERPGIVRRYLCACLDSVILGSVWLGIAPAVAFSNIEAYSHGFPSGVVGAFSTVATVTVSMLYFSLMHYKYGQTIGKMAGGYKVVNLDGSNPSFATCVSRAFWLSGIQIIQLISLLSTRNFVVVVGLTQGIASMYTLVNSIFLIVDGQYQRALHDRIAGTRVVMTRKV